MNFVSHSSYDYKIVEINLKMLFYHRFQYYPANNLMISIDFHEKCFIANPCHKINISGRM